MSTLELYDSFRTPDVGVCVTPVAAGSACTVGYGENLDLILSLQEVRMPQDVVIGIIQLEDSKVYCKLRSGPIAACIPADPISRAKSVFRLAQFAQPAHVCMSR